MNPCRKLIIIIIATSLLLAGCLHSSDDSHLSVHMIDIGQGDSFLIKTPEGITMLIDGGLPQESDQLIAYLKRHHVNQIDYMIATHPHADHIGGLIPVMKELPVHHVIMPAAAHTSLLYESFLETVLESQADIQVVQASSQHSIERDVSFEILYTGIYYGSNLNDWSVVLRLIHDEMSFLFTGDLESGAEMDLLNYFSPEQLSSEVLKVGHHGSSTSTTQPFLNAVQPKIALISCSIDNPYGHPSDQVIHRLEAAGVWIYRSDLQGSVILHSDGEKIWSHQAPVNLSPVSSADIFTKRLSLRIDHFRCFSVYAVPFQKQAVQMVPAPLTNAILHFIPIHQRFH